MLKFHVIGIRRLFPSKTRYILNLRICLHKKSSNIDNYVKKTQQELSTN